MRDAVRTLDELTAIVKVPAEALQPPPTASFPLFATREFLSRVDPDDPTDPLLRQILPVPAEDDPVIQRGLPHDPLCESRFQPAHGMLRKYRSRVLLVTTGVCPVHCRYCFRRHFPYGESTTDPSILVEAVREIRDDADDIDEIILSGGDPLTLSDARLTAIVENLAAIPGLRRLRVHSRMPIAVPQRVTVALTELLRSTRLTPWVVIHANHPHEIDQYVHAAIGALVDAGIPVLNQSVLLRGVNDDAGVLVELSQRLLAARAIPYYLHVLDRVRGAAHFHVHSDTALGLIEHMRRHLPGFAVPRLVSELPGEDSKTVIA